MSIFGAMTTAISGLSSQSTAFSNIGDNLANTQTTGYKGVDTTFENYVTSSTLQTNGSSAVVARPEYTNTTQGTISQTTNPLDIAVSGQGFFPVSLPNGSVQGQPTFGSQQYFTREGDFKLDANGYLVNSTGHFLNAWPINAAGQVDQTQLKPLQVGQSGYAPVPTSSATISANLPATPATTPYSVTTEMPVTDSLGTSHNLDLTWSTTATPNVWSLSIANGATTIGSVNVAFGSASTNPVPEGTIGSVTATGAGLTPSAYVAGQQATVDFTATLGPAAQPITLNLGTFGGTNGVTQFAGSTYNLISLSQNGVEPGGFAGVSMQSNGNLTVNYDNGQSRTVGQIPIVTFASPDSLQTHDGQAYTATKESGNPRANQVGSNGAGTLVTSSLEGSNVDIASEFTKLIVAQRAYSANTKMVTTADDMLQQTIDMKR